MSEPKRGALMDHRGIGTLAAENRKLAGATVASVLRNEPAVAECHCHQLLHTVGAHTHSPQGSPATVSHSHKAGAVWHELSV